MKTNSATSASPLVMAEWVPLTERAELSLIFMVAASVGEVVLASRGFAGVGYASGAVAGGFVFCALWVLPGRSLGNVARTLVLGFAWSVLFTGIEAQTISVMTDPVSHQEVVSQ
jgi:hypothetical protein